MKEHCYLIMYGQNMWVASKKNSYRSNWKGGRTNWNIMSTYTYMVYILISYI